MKMWSESGRDLLGGQKDTAVQTVFCCPPGQPNRRGWKRRRSRRDLGRRKERLASHLSHSTPSKSWGRDLGSMSGLGKTWCSESPGGYDFGGLGNSGDWARLDWSSTSTRGGSDVTRSPTGEAGGRLDWSNKAGTRGLWGGEYDWSTSSTRGVGAGLDKLSDATSAPTGKVAGRLDWSSSNAGTRGGWGGDYDWSTSSTRGAEAWLGKAGRLDWSSSNAGTRGVWGGDYDWSKSSTRGAGAWLGKMENDWSTLSTGGVGAGVDKIETQLGNWEDDSNLNNQHLLSPPYLPGQVTQSSPVFCDGCHSWGNLLAVTVSQTRGM